MKAADDWRGENLIRIKPDDAARKAESGRISAAMGHKRRQARGEPAPAAKQHAAFMRAVWEGDVECGPTTTTTTHSPQRGCGR